LVDRKIFAVDFEPVVQINQRVLLLPEEKCFPVEWIEPLPLIEVDFGAISAGATIEKEVDQIYLGRNELGQYRFAPITADVIIKEFWSPKGARMWTTEKTAATLTWYVDYADQLVNTLQTTEFFQYEDKRKFLHLYSEGGVTKSIVRFYGYVFILGPQIEPPEKPYISIPTTARTAIRSE